MSAATALTACLRLWSTSSSMSSGHSRANSEGVITMSNKSHNTGELRPGYLPSFRKRIPFVDALELFKQYPALCESAFGRLERLILREGLDEARMARLARLGYPKTIKSYGAFSKRFKGID